MENGIDLPFLMLMIISDREIEWVLNKFASCFKDEASKWTKKRAESVKIKEFY